MASELRVDKIVPTTGVPTGGGGGIVQVKSTSFTGDWSGSSGGSTFDIITDLNTTITPKFNTSKILIMVTIGGWDSNGQNQRGAALTQYIRQHHRLRQRPFHLYKIDQGLQGIHFGSSQ